jgi:urease accessory protein
MNAALARLLQLASPTLPVGAYTYSQGLEWAVEAGWIVDEASTLEWIGDLLDNTIGTFDAPLVACAHRAWSQRDATEAMRLDALFVASRESAELRSETLQMGYSLRRMLDDVRDLPRPDGLNEPPAMSFPIVWAGVASACGVAAEETVVAYLWSWCENQTIAALKSVPLGQAAGQRTLTALGARLAAVARRAVAMPEDEWHNFAPGFAIACSRHETQYSRLFRS